MKLFIVVAFALLVQALALPAVENPAMPEHMPEDPTMPEHMPEDPSKPEHRPINEEVQAFRDAIDYRFTRFQVFYDLINDQMTQYRLRHVESVSEITLGLMRVFAEDLDYIRTSIDYTNGVINDVLAELGGSPNACLQDVMNRLTQNSATLGTAINNCSRRANNTVARGLSEVFYPTFADIQNSVSTVPLLTLGALSRGNVFEDSQAILDYLESQYNVITMQWRGAVSQLFRWETTHWEVEGLFYTEEIIDCFADPVYYYSNANTLLMFTAWDNCRP
ncbi:hypothetical protein PVAND_003498 [Polypedilum vanderplanki]|uniref:Uncharacterized protein n=1 Tax=Polypedilum vanderplanki TaxID=319348 RepID=A0A9J6BU88_POLVA|nr:hypothetical protein PVAND_003498 [Polypedilum vanderplanki]